MKSASQTVNPPPQRVFGLGIDEKIQWVVADVQGPCATLGDQMICEPFDINFEGRSHPQVNLYDAIHQALSALRYHRPRLFHDISAIGVSTIGVVESHFLRSIVRKNVARRLDAPLIDFSELFKEFFDAEAVERLTVLNDASAKALAEHNLAREIAESNVESTLHLMFDEGVNGGIIVGSRLLASSLNPEMGHIRPRLNPHDQGFTLEEGRKSCPAHGDCFEGIASGARIRHSWGGANPRFDFNISDLPFNHPAWEVISDYISQLCMVGTLMLSPTQIIIGGTIATGREGDHVSKERVLKKLWPLIRKKFLTLNNHYLFYKEMMASDFIRPAMVTADANVVAALQAARLGPFPEVLSKPINLWAATAIRVISNA